MKRTVLYGGPAIRRAGGAAYQASDPEIEAALWDQAAVPAVCSRGGTAADCSDCKADVVVPEAWSAKRRPEPASSQSRYAGPRAWICRAAPAVTGRCAEMAGGASNPTLTGRPLTPTLSHGEREKERPAEESLADLRSCLLGRGSKRGADSGSELGAVGRDRLGDR